MDEESAALAILQQFSAGGIQPDPAQNLIMARLASLLTEVVGGAGKGASGLGANRGIFLWGGVGRGKTSLLDATVAASPRGMACRWHQLAFLDAFHRSFAGPARHDFAKAIDRLVGSARLLAFDEFHIHDVADAQILRRAFCHLAERGVRLLVTANPPPAGFRECGERQRHFAPLISFLEAWCESIELNGGVDYRRIDRQAGRRWLVRDNSAAREEAMAELKKLRGCVESAAFDALCRRPHCHADYARLVESAGAFALWTLPRFGERDGDALRRLVWLADVLWERQIPLAITAAAGPAATFECIGNNLLHLLGRDLARAESRLVALCGLAEQFLTAASANP
jgi:cell division protein ZapE